MGDLRKEIQTKLREQVSMISQLEDRLALFDSKFEKFLIASNQREKRFLALQETMATKEAMTFTDVDWDYAPDHSKPRIYATANVSRPSLLSGVGPWLSLFDSADWLPLGPVAGVDMDWTIIFPGPTGLAARRAKKAMQFLRDEEGSWHKYQAVSPCEDRVVIFFPYDKSPKQRKVETNTESLGRVIESLYPDFK
eukprot:1752625-Karenia_brevis.AAC.1